MQRNKTNQGFFKPLDLNITILLKFISDWSSLLKKISPFASIVFVCLNLKTIISSKKAIITVLLLVPALILTPGTDMLRLIMTVCILWIFLDKFDHPYTTFSFPVAVVVAIYSCVMVSGIFTPEYYLRMDGGALRYKFILESHNALSILALMFFVYLCNTLIMLAEKKEPTWKFLVILIPFLLVCVTLLFIKSRLYIGLSLLLLILVALKTYKISKLLALSPVAYLIFFVLLSQFSIDLTTPPPPKPAITQVIPKAVEAPMPTPAAVPDSGKTTAAPAKNHKEQLLPSKSHPKPVEPIQINKVTPDASVKKADTLTQTGKVIDNTRVLSFSSTGRGPMIQLFFDMFSEMGWQQFIYQNNTKAYFERKKKLPSIDVTVSSLTENTYLVIVLNAGLVGLLVFLFIFGYYALTFFKRKEYLSLLYFLFLLAVWFFEETVMFPFSMITHLLALATINRFERKHYEGSISN